MFSCAECSHRYAIHTSPPSLHGERDYHDQYDQGEFLSSLEKTRRRQAGILARAIKAAVGPDAGVLDYGSGRGWFLDACREEGFRKLAGADSSTVALRLLQERGIPGILVPLSPPRLRSGAPLSLPFAPEVLTFLDVVEHFPGHLISDSLNTIVREVGDSLRLVVIKIPTSQGLLYRLAETLATIGWSGPVEQLYQVGTSPPHYHYFCPRSMIQLAGSLKLTLYKTMHDLDFEPELLYRRIHATSGLPKALGVTIGACLGLLARVTRMEDTMICFLRPKVPSANTNTSESA